MHVSQENTGQIGIITATAISLNAVIGAGPFGAPTTLADNNGVLTICTYAFAMFSVWLVSYSLARVAYLYAQPGSFYAYAHPWGGPIAGWIAVTAYLISLFTAMGVLTHVASSHLTYIVPYDPVPTGYVLLGVSLLLHMFAWRFSKWSQLALLAGTVFLLIATIGICLIQADWRNVQFPDEFSWYTMLTPSYSVLFGFLGFETATGLHALIADAKHNVPRAITYSVIATGPLYLLYVSGLVLAVPRAAFEQETVLLTSVLEHISPHTWALTYAIHGALLSAILGTLHATTWSAGVLMRTLFTPVPLKGRFWENGSIIVSVAIVTISYMLFRNIDIGLRITVITRSIAYLFAIITLLLAPQSWRSHYAYIGLTAMCAVGTVLFFALT